MKPSELASDNDHKPHSGSRGPWRWGPWKRHLLDADQRSLCGLRVRKWTRNFRDATCKACLELYQRQPKIRESEALKNGCPHCGWSKGGGHADDCTPELRGSPPVTVKLEDAAQLLATIEKETT